MSWYINISFKKLVDSHMNQYYVEKLYAVSSLVNFLNKVILFEKMKTSLHKVMITNQITREVVIKGMTNENVSEHPRKRPIFLHSSENYSGHIIYKKSYNILKHSTVYNKESGVMHNI